MGVLALDDQFFYFGQSMVLKIWNTGDFILIIVAIAKNVHRFLAIIILKLQLDKLLLDLIISKL